jgi:predicted small secreted protein
MVGQSPTQQFTDALNGLKKESKMAKRILILVVLIVTLFSILGCQTAKGIKEDVQFIGDKTYEMLDKP